MPPSNATYLKDSLQTLRPQLLLYLYGRTRNWAEAEDLAQVALLKAWENQHKLEEHTKLRPWLYTIARRALFDRARRGPKEQLTSAGELPESALEPAVSQTITSDIERPCACALSLTNTLSPGQAELIRLVDVEEHSLSEAAEKIATSKNAANVRLFRARQTLKERLRDHCGVTDARSATRCACDSKTC